MKHAISTLILTLTFALVAMLTNAKDTPIHNIKSSQPVNIAKEINHLYMTAINSKTPEAERKNIICNQLPSLLNKYESLSTNQTNKDLVIQLQQNIKISQEHHKVSCS